MLWRGLIIIEITPVGPLGGVIQSIQYKPGLPGYRNHNIIMFFFSPRSFALTSKYLNFPEYYARRSFVLHPRHAKHRAESTIEVGNAF